MRIAKPAIVLGCLVVLSGCGTHPAAPIDSRDLSRSIGFASRPDFYTVYWVGRSFRGVPLTAADTGESYESAIGLRFYYGDCEHVALLDSRGCRLPLQISTVIWKPHSNDGLGPHRNTTIRGVPAVIFDHGSSIELYTSHAAVDIYADSPQRARAAAEHIQPLNRKRPLGRILPPPRFRPGIAKDPEAEVIAIRLRSIDPNRPPPRRG